MRGKLIALLLCISVMGTMNPAYVSAEENVSELSDAPVIETVIEEEIEAIETDIDGQIDLDTVDEIVEEEEPEVGGEEAPVPTVITTKEQLLALRDALNILDGPAKDTDYTLGADIDMGGADWIMPANSPKSFDGCNHTISNINIKFDSLPAPTGTGGYYCLGMFNNTTVSNLTLNNTTVHIKDFNKSCINYGTMIGTGNATNCHITGDTKFLYDGATKYNSLYMGGIVGAASSVTDEIKNCTVDGLLDFSGINWKGAVAGGVVGVIVGLETDDKTVNIANCITKDSCVIKSKYRASGIVGGNMSGGKGRRQVVTIQGCENKASIEGAEIAGIAWTHTDSNKSKLNIKIDSCKNYRNFDFEGKNVTVCGIAAGANEISNCANYGNIKTDSSAVGVISYVDYNGIIENCVNKGNITGIGGADGIALGASSCNVSECYNTGDITSASSASGIISSYTLYKGTDSKIEKCFNSGNIVGSAGLIGSVMPRGEDHIAGVPEKFSLVISDCFNCGIVCPYAGSTSFSTGLIGFISYNAGGRGLDGRCLSDNISISLERCYNIGAVGEAEDTKKYSADTTGNQIVRYLDPYSDASNQKFNETDCYYLKDPIARAMPKQDSYNYMAVCQIDEKALSEAELKNAFSSHSTIWANGKTGYEFPYLKGVGESDLPANFSHNRQLEELSKLMKSALVKDENAMYPDKNGRVISFTATTLDNDGNKVPVDISDFINFPKSDSNKDILVLKAAKEMKILGYTFKGWYTTINGKEKKVTKLKLSTLDDNVVLTAKYVVQQIKVSYKITKPAAGVKPTGKIAAKKYKFTENITLGGSEISAPGYKLIGWTRDKKNTTVADYNVGANVDISDLLLKGKSVKLYAVWATE